MDPTLDAAAARRALLRHSPKRDFGELRLLGEGWDSIVYVAGDATVLRFPKSANAARALETEVRLLPYLRARLALPIPAPEIVNEHPCDPAWRFMGYPRIGGIELTRELFATLDSSAQARAMRDLAEFLATLHDSDESEVRRCGVIARDLRAEFVDVFARSQTAIAPLLERDERRAFIEWSRAILADGRLFTARPSLIHGDLSPEHIFYDTTAQRICGIIDFGDCAIADPDYDLMYLLEDYGRPFVDSLLRYYQHPDREGLHRKLEAFRLFDATRYVLVGHARADPEMIRDGLRDLRHLLRVRQAPASET